MDFLVFQYGFAESLFCYLSDVMKKCSSAFFRNAYFPFELHYMKNILELVALATRGIGMVVMIIKFTEWVCYP